MKKNINLLLLATLTFSAQAMELPTKQLSLLEVLPDELKVEIFKALTSVEKETKDKALAQAAKNIRALSVTSSTFAVLAKDKKLTGELIKELADRYTDGDLVKAAIALGTDAASEWITSQVNPYIQGAISDKLVEASKYDDVKAVQFFLKYLSKDRVDVIVNGMTPLMYAVGNKHEKIVDLLLVAGADVNAQNDAGTTPLIFAIFADYLPTLDRLLKAPLIDLNKKNNLNRTPLAIALSLDLKNRYVIINKLIAAGADVNTVDASGVTPLMLAIDENNVKLVDLLLFAGADPNIKVNHGTTALMIAVRRGLKDIVQSLIAAKADINAQDNRNQTALLVATLHNQYLIAKQLLEAGANPNLKDNANRTPLWYLKEQARRSADVRIDMLIFLLKKYGAE